MSARIGDMRFGPSPPRRGPGLEAWQWLLGLFFLSLLLQGAFRKWFVPDWERQVLIACDVLLLLAFAFYLLQRSRTRGDRWPLLPAHPILIGFALLGALAVAGIFNPRSGGITASLVGARYFLIALPLVVLGARAFTGIDGLYRAGLWFSATVIPMSVVALVQVTSPPDAAINWYVGSGAPSAFGAFVRTTGTFSYITPFTDYLTFVAVVALGLVLTSRRRRGQLLSASLLVLAVGTMFTTGSRRPVGLVVAVGAAVLLVLLADRRVRTRTVARLVPVLVGLALILTVGMPTVARAFQLRVETSGDVGTRLEGILAGPLITLDATPVLGYGVGATFQGIGRIDPDRDRDTRITWDEVVTDPVIRDLGWPGLLAETAIRCAIALALIGVFWRSTDPRARTFALVILFYQLSFFLYVPVYQYTAMCFVAFSAGLTIWLSESMEGSREAIGW